MRANIPPRYLADQTSRLWDLVVQGWCHLCQRNYTVLQKYAHIGLKQNLRSTTLDIITRLRDNAAFVCVHVVGRFSKDFSEVRELRSREFQLQVEWMTTVLCAELWKEVWLKLATRICRFSQYLGTKLEMLFEIARSGKTAENTILLLPLST